MLLVLFWVYFSFGKWRKQFVIKFQWFLQTETAKWNCELGNLNWKSDFRLNPCSLQRFTNFFFIISVDIACDSQTILVVSNCMLFPKGKYEPGSHLKKCQLLRYRTEKQPPKCSTNAFKAFCSSHKVWRFCTASYTITMFMNSQRLLILSGWLILAWNKQTMYRVCKQVYGFMNLIKLILRQRVMPD